MHYVFRKNALDDDEQNHCDEHSHALVRNEDGGDDLDDTCRLDNGNDTNSNDPNK